MRGAVSLTLVQRCRRNYISGIVESFSSSSNDAYLLSLMVSCQITRPLKILACLVLPLYSSTHLSIIIIVTALQSVQVNCI